MDARQALDWANSISRSLAAAMGCDPVEITLDILMRFYLPANKDASTDEARKTNILGGILRAGGYKLAKGDARKLRSQKKGKQDAAAVECAIKGALVLTGESVKDVCDPLRRSVEVVNEKIESKLAEEATSDQWTVEEEEKLLDVLTLLCGYGLIWILVSLALEGELIVVLDGWSSALVCAHLYLYLSGKSPEQCRTHAKTARLNRISRQDAAGEEVSAENRLFEAEYVAKRDAANERERLRNQANKNKYEEIDGRIRVNPDSVSEEDRLFHAKYEADRAASNKNSREWRKANKDAVKERDRRRRKAKKERQEENDRRLESEAWRESFAILKSILRPDGTVDYSALDAGDGSARGRMIIFVDRQRSDYRDRKNKAKSSMTEEQYQLLVEVNFQFVTNIEKKPKNLRQSWRGNLDMLRSILRPDGTVDYSVLSLDHERRMRNFVKQQRNDYRRREENKVKSPICRGELPIRGSRTGKKKTSS